MTDLEKLYEARINGLRSVHVYTLEELAENEAGAADVAVGYQVGRVAVMFLPTVLDGGGFHLEIHQFVDETLSGESAALTVRPPT